jgi:hypothetical protein
VTSCKLPPYGTGTERGDLETLVFALHDLGAERIGHGTSCAVDASFLAEVRKAVLRREIAEMTLPDPGIFA